MVNGALTLDNKPAVTGFKSGFCFCPLGLDHVPDFRGDVRPAEPRDGADAGRRGHVDLGQVAVDDVNADKQQSARAQRRA